MSIDWRGMRRTTLRGLCPRCGEGGVFGGAYVIRERCERCGLGLRGREGAHYGGPIALGYGIGGIAGLLSFSVLFAIFGFRPAVVWGAVGAVVVSILLAFRYCKGWWTWWLFTVGELERDPPPR